MARPQKLPAWVESAFNLQQHEVPLLLNAFGAFFCVLASFFLLLPLREEAGVSLGTATLPWLFMSSVIVTTIVAPLTSAFLSRPGVTRDVAVMQLLQFFSASLLGMYVLHECTLMAVAAVQPASLQPSQVDDARRHMLNPGAGSHAPGSQAPDPLSLSKLERARLGDPRLTGMQRTLRAVFYCWINVMNLLAISSLWARCADVFSAEAAARLFGAISAGGTAGQLGGSILAGTYSVYMPPNQSARLLGFLMPVSAAIMFTASILISRLKPKGEPEGKRSATEREPQRGQDAGSSEQSEKGATGAASSRQVKALLEGFQLVANSRYLCLLCAFVLVHTIISSLLYFVRATVIATQLHGAASRTSFFAAVNSAAASVQVVLQLFATGNILRWTGVPWALFASPIAALLGLVSIFIHPAAATVAGVEVGRKIVQYTMTKPAREMLFTVVTRKEKYKAKLLVDTLVIRAGDALAAAVFQYLDSHLHVSSQTVVLLAVACCGLWMLLAYKLGNYYRELAPQTLGHTAR